MLKKFSISSILYCISAYLLAAFIILNETRVDIDDEEFWTSVVLVVHATTQMIYTLRTRRMLSLTPYKDMNTLDDFMTQTMDIDSKVIENSGLMKTFGFLGILGTIVSIVTGAAMFYYILETIFSEWREVDEVSLVFISLAALAFGIPTLIYNIRTFAMKCIDKVNP